MKYLIAILLALPMLAQAQPAPPPCFPLVNGYSVGAPKIINTDIGTHLFWFCGDVKRTKVEVAGFSCEKARCSETALSAAIFSVTRASAKVGTAKELWATAVTLDCATDTGPLCTERNRLRLENDAVWWAEVKDWVQP